jgi:hypothetical protein
MLHFLIGTALCIWIAERVAHYWGERRHQKLVARMLNTTSSPATERGLLLPGVAVLAALAVVLLFAH